MFVFAYLVRVSESSFIKQSPLKLSIYRTSRGSHLRTGQDTIPSRLRLWICWRWPSTCLHVRGSFSKSLNLVDISPILPYSINSQEHVALLQFSIILQFSQPSSSPRGFLHWLESLCLPFPPLSLHIMWNTLYTSWQHCALNSLYILSLPHHTPSAAQMRYDACGLLQHASEWWRRADCRHDSCFIHNPNQSTFSAILDEAVQCQYLSVNNLARVLWIRQTVKDPGICLHLAAGHAISSNLHGFHHQK